MRAILSNYLEKPSISNFNLKFLVVWLSSGAIIGTIAVPLKKNGDNLI